MIWLNKDGRELKLNTRLYDACCCAENGVNMDKSIEKPANLLPASLPEVKVTAELAKEVEDELNKRDPDEKVAAKILADFADDGQVR